MRYRVIQENIEIGISRSIVYIYLGENGAYQECPFREAQGFCVKMPVSLPDDCMDDVEGTEGTSMAEMALAQAKMENHAEDQDGLLADMVFSLAGKNLLGAIGEASVEEIE